MTITNGYCTLADLKLPNNRLNIEGSDSGQDDMLEAIIESVSRRIDKETHRFFYQTSSQSRWYTPLNSEYVFIDDISADSDISAIAIDTNDDGTVDDTFTTSDYVLEPFNASLEGWVYEKITRRSSGQFLFPTNAIKSVKVTALFGWSSIPKEIVEACKLQSERLYMRGQTPIGSMSMSALGKQTLNIPNLDPDVCDLIAPYIKTRAMFA